MQGQFGPVHSVGRPPNQDPTVIAGDAFAGRIDLGLTVDFGSCRDDELAVVPNILGYEPNDRCFDLGRINGNDRLARNHSPIRRIVVGNIGVFPVIAMVEREGRNDRRDRCAIGRSSNATWRTAMFVGKAGIGHIRMPTGRLLRSLVYVGRKNDWRRRRGVPEVEHAGQKTDRDEENEAKGHDLAGLGFKEG